VKTEQIVTHLVSEAVAELREAEGEVHKLRVRMVSGRHSEPYPGMSLYDSLNLDFNCLKERMDKAFKLLELLQ